MSGLKKHKLLVKGLLLAVLLTSSAYAQDHLHLWTLQSKTQDGSVTVCTWRCMGLGGTHYAATTGSGGACFRP